MKSKIMDVIDSKSLERDAAENWIPLFLMPLYEDTATHRIFYALWPSVDTGAEPWKNSVPEFRTKIARILSRRQRH
jgi:hypothetical protein